MALLSTLSWHNTIFLWRFLWLLFKCLVKINENESVNQKEYDLKTPTKLVWLKPQECPLSCRKRWESSQMQCQRAKVVHTYLYGLPLPVVYPNRNSTKPTFLWRSGVACTYTCASLNSKSKFGATTKLVWICTTWQNKNNLLDTNL